MPFQTDIALRIDDSAVRRTGGAFDELARRAGAAEGAASALGETLQRRLGVEGTRALQTLSREAQSSLERGVGGAADRAASRIVSMGSAIEGAGRDAALVLNATLGRALSGGVDSAKELGGELARSLNRLTASGLRSDLVSQLGIGGTPFAGAFGSGGIFDIGRLLGFAGGGRFVVPGAGPPDSRLVAFRATPGEEVSVARPRRRATPAPGGGTVNVVMNVTTPDSDGFRRAQGQILADLQRQLRRWDVRNN